MLNASTPHGRALRGHGRTAYRAGKLAHQAVTFAAECEGRDLDEAERLVVMAGWAAERSEACPC